MIETVSTPERPRLLPEEAYQRLKTAFWALHKKGENLLEEQRALLVTTVNQDIAGDDPKLQELYARLFQDAIAEFKAVLQLPFWRDIFEKIIQSNGNIDENTFAGIEMDTTALARIRMATHAIQVLGFDENKEAFEKSPLVCPFDTIDIHDLQWEQILKIAENFRHSFNKLFDIFYLDGIVEQSSRKGRRHHAPGLVCQVKALPDILELMEGYEREIVGEAREEEVDMARVLFVEELFLNGRFLEELDERDSNILRRQGLPIQILAIGAVVLKNVDLGRIKAGLKEVVVNCFRPGKIPQAELVRFVESGRPYLTLLTEVVEVRGVRCVKIEVIDRGEQIDINKIRETMDLGDFEFTDYTVAKLLRFLSRRRKFVPLKNNASMSTGIGLATASEIIEKYGGDIYFTNMRNRGVRCMILIPEEGAQSKEKLSEMDIKGRELDKIAAKIDGDGNVIMDETVDAQNCGDDFEAGEAVVHRLFRREVLELTRQFREQMKQPSMRHEGDEDAEGGLIEIAGRREEDRMPQSPEPRQGQKGDAGEEVLKSAA